MGQVHGADAKTLRNSNGPANLPPSTFKGNYFVDNAGCGYVRAGYGGNTQWVPRVQRNRTLVCGQTPTFAAARTVKTQTARVDTSQQQQQQQTAAVTTTTTQPRNKINWNWILFGKPKTRTTTYGNTETAMVLPVEPKEKKVTTSRDVVEVTQNGYRTHKTYTVRLVPQAVHPGDYAKGKRDTQQVVVTRGNTQSYEVAALPKGYTSLLTEDYNPTSRGGTQTGNEAMRLIWTDTMPRRLIDTYTGQDVTAANPKIRYPYTTAVSTKAYLPNGAVMTSTSTVKATTTTRKKKVEDEASPENMVERLNPDEIKNIETVMAEADAPAKKVVSAADPGLGAFVQVATFGVPSNATRTMARFDAAGLPVTARPLTRGGKAYQIILLGPFRDQAALSAGLSAARQAGFSDAFKVK